MDSPDLVFQNFPALDDEMKDRINQLAPLYNLWNERVNLISRKDIEHLYLHHVLHSLGIAKVISFLPGTHVIDAGTGGGFPGIPLAILFPDTHFHLVDSIGKKINVVKEIATSLGLKNVTATHVRVEELDEKTDFVVSRAVTTLKEMCTWTLHLIRPGGIHALRNGILFLKGGDLGAEIRELRRNVEVLELNNYFHQPFFETKKVAYISA